eukprot:gene4094-5122_t
MSSKKVKKLKKEQQQDDDESNNTTTLENHWKNSSKFNNELKQEQQQSNDISEDDQDDGDDHQDNKKKNNKNSKLKRKLSEFELDNNKVKKEEESSGDENPHFENTISKSERVKNSGVKKYLKGGGVVTKGIKNPVLKSRVKKVNELKKQAAKAAYHSEILLQNESGFIVPDEGEKTYEITQRQIVENVDIQSAAKVFDLNLQPNGPYTFDYTKEGRYLLLGGERGHFSVIDWSRGKKFTERHLHKPIRDACFLHNETMFALAQKKYTYIYSNQGVELHCLREHMDPKFLQFLPYHFLLVSATNRGHLVYEDVSIGRTVAKHEFKNRMTAICKNPENAAINLGYSNGVVEMWIPKSNTPVVKVLCHKTSITSVACNLTGDYMVTTGLDKMVKVFDLRNTYQELHAFKCKGVPNSISISDTNVLALAHENEAIMWKNPFNTSITEPYLVHRTLKDIKKVKFCPYEDILGIGQEYGYSSIMVPGSGEANYDSNVADPFASKKMKREQEVHALLEKIPYDMITLNSNIIGSIQKDVKTDEDKHKRKDEVRLDKNRIPFDPKKIEEIDKRNKERKEKREKDILDTSTVKSALSRFTRK